MDWVVLFIGLALLMALVWVVTDTIFSTYESMCTCHGAQTARDAWSHAPSAYKQWACQSNQWPGVM
jgi:hypothetical protein